MQYLSIIIKSQYLKPIFKSKKLTVGIWETITYKKQYLVYFLVKKG